VRLVDYVNEGIRPVQSNDDCKNCSDCLQVCPAVETDFLMTNAVVSHESRKWGQVLEIWEGHASDPEIRFKGSSGGALTALSAYCLERLGMHGVLHIGADESDPVRNRTRLSKSREDLLKAVGSRYSPAAVCEHLELVEKAPSQCVVIGKPSEIAGLTNAIKVRPGLGAKVGVALSFFCAESPSTNGTLALLDKMRIDGASLGGLRYRGFGWPGHFAPTLKGATEPDQKISYRESWGFLQAFRPWSVQLWPDGTGELADISCGDPWYEQPDGQNPGFSLVVVRTPRGQEIVRGAIEAGYLQLKQAEFWKLEKSQSGLIKKKGAVWGRRLALRLAGLPVTKFRNLDLFHCWRKLSFSEQVKSIVGTLRRIMLRKLYRRLDLSSENRRSEAT